MKTQTGFSVDGTRKKDVPMRIILMFIFFISLPGCTTLSSKIKESDEVNSLALKRGFIESPVKAVKQNSKSCLKSPANTWVLSFSKTLPMMKHQKPGGKTAYGPYKVLCFLVKGSSTKRSLFFSTSSVGGGYNKSFYVVPFFSLFDVNFNRVEIGKINEFGQTFVLGDLYGKFPFKAKNGKYYLVVGADNRFPKIPWAYYSYGTIVSDRFPVKVYSSVSGKVEVKVIEQ